MTMTGGRPPDRPDTSVRDRCQRPALVPSVVAVALGMREQAGRAGGKSRPCAGRRAAGSGYDSQARVRQSGLRPRGADMQARDGLADMPAGGGRRGRRGGTMYTM